MDMDRNDITVNVKHGAACNNSEPAPPNHFPIHWD